MMKPDMGEIQRMSPSRVKREESAPGGHPEAENVPPSGTPTLTKGDDGATVTTRLGMSPLKMKLANMKRSASPLYKAASPTPSPAARTLPLTPATGALRKPMVILRRLEPKAMRRISDIQEMGLNKACAKRIRKELARSKRNCRRRYLRKVGRRMAGKKTPLKRIAPSPLSSRAKRRRVAREEMTAGSRAGADGSFSSPPKKRSQDMPNHSSSPLTALPQPHGWSSHHLHPHANLSSKYLTNGTTSSHSPLAPSTTLEPHPVTPTLQGASRLLFPASESLCGVKNENHKSQLNQKSYELAASTSSSIWFPPTLMPHHTLPQQPGASSQVNGTLDSTDQSQMHSPLAVSTPKVTAQHSIDHIIGMRSPPPLIPLPKVEGPGISHSRTDPHGSQVSRWMPHEIPSPNLKGVLPCTPEPPPNVSVQGHHTDPRAPIQPPGSQRTAVIAVRMKTADPSHNPMVLIPASLSHSVHSSIPPISPDHEPHPATTPHTAPQTPAHQSLVPSRVIARTNTVPSNTIWIVGGQQSSTLPFASVSQSSKPALQQHYVSALPSIASPSSHHTSTSSRQEVPQDLSPGSSSVTCTAVRQRVINTSVPVSSSQLSLLLTAGLPLVPVSSTSASNTVTTITRAPVVPMVSIQASMKEQGDDMVSYETKKIKAAKSRKPDPDQVIQVKRIKIEKEVEGTLRASEDSFTKSSALPMEEKSPDTTSCTTLPPHESSTTPVTPAISAVNKTTSTDQRSKPNYVAVISITPPTTTTVITTMSSTTTSPATQTTTSIPVTNPLLLNLKTLKCHREDLPNGTVSPSTKELSLAHKASVQDSNTKTPFILMPKKRLHFLTETEVSSVKGTPISVVKQLREGGEVVNEEEPLSRLAIIHTTAEWSGKSVEECQAPTTPSPSVTPSGSSSSSPSRVIVKVEDAASPAQTVATSPPSAYLTSRIAKKQLKKAVVVVVKRLTETSFTAAFLTAQGVSVACGARLCRHLKVLQGAGQYHRPLNRRKFRAYKAVPIFKTLLVHPTAPSPEIPRPIPSKLQRLPEVPDPIPSSAASSSPSPSQSPVVPPLPMAPAKISEAAGILHLNPRKKRRLMVLRNKRLKPSNLKMLFEVGLDIAKKASRNSTLDRMGIKGPILDPGYFGINGTSRPSQSQGKPSQPSQSQPNQSQPSQASQSQPSQPSQVPSVPQKVRRPKKAPVPAPPRQTQPRIYFPDGNVLVLQQQQQEYQQQQQHQQQYARQVPPVGMSIRPGVPPPVMNTAGSSVSHSVPRTVLLQATDHPHRAKLVIVDPLGPLREAFLNRVPHGYSHYPGPAPGPSSTPQPEAWTNRPQMSRDSFAPPLTFMGPPGMGSMPREHIQQSQVQPIIARPPASRAVPPPLSFMGQSAETNSWARPQHPQQPTNLSWPRMGHPPRAYPVINHTKHVIHNKAPPTYFGPPSQYTPKSSYDIQGLVFQKQPHSNTTTATPRHNPNSHQLASAEWHGSPVHQGNPHLQEHHHRVTTAGVSYPLQNSGAHISSEQCGRTQQAATVIQGDPGTTTHQQAADPGQTESSSHGPIAASNSTTTTTTTSITPSTSSANVDHHQCHQTWLPEVMAVVEALLLQLVDAGLPTRESFIIHTLKQLLYARSNLTLSPAFCCTAQEKRWYVEFYNTHSQRLKAQEEAKQPIHGIGQDQVRQWLTKLKEDMFKFQGASPQRIYFLHELNFFLDQQTREVKYHRMFPGLPMMSPGSKDTISVLFTLGADGQVGPGMIIFPRMVIPERLFESLRRVAGDGEWVLGSSANGWLTRDCVLEFVSDVFVPWLRRRAVHFPTALFSSEYISGVSVVPVADRFVAQGVQLISVPRELVSVLSPAEWIIGYRLRWHWGRVVKEWSDAHDNKPLLEENFAPFLIRFLKARATPNKVTEKFATFGICPFNAQTMFYFLLKYHSLSTKRQNSQLENGS